LFSVKAIDTKVCPNDPLVSIKILFLFKARGVRKITRGITGLWQPSVHSDVAVWSFDVGSSYHYEAELIYCRIVHPSIGNVSWG